MPAAARSSGSGGGAEMTVDEEPFARCSVGASGRKAAEELRLDMDVLGVSEGATEDSGRGSAGAGGRITGGSGKSGGGETANGGATPAMTAVGSTSAGPVAVAIGAGR